MQVAHKVISTFAYQVFHTGFVHADPHPGNIFIRPIPGGQGAQVVLLDHGLYMPLEDRYVRTIISTTLHVMCIHVCVALEKACVDCGSPSFYMILKL